MAIARERRDRLRHTLMEAQRGTSRVSLSAGAYETQRAIDAGLRVAKEVRDATTGRPAASTRAAGPSAVKGVT